MTHGPGILRWVVVVITIWIGLTSLRAFAAPKHKAKVIAGARVVAGAPASSETTGGARKKKIVYRSHTQIDLSGETVQGKIRAPEVFYIFQRKRSQSHHVVAAPDNFAYHTDELRSTIGRSLPK